MESPLPSYYRAIQCSEPRGTWEIVNLPMRGLAPTEVLVRVHASGICNSDHFIKDGTWPGAQYPRIAGHEVIGRIAGVGVKLLEIPVHQSRLRLGALVGVGWNGGFCTQCDYCRKGEFWTCRDVDYTGFTIDGGHGEYMFAPSTAITFIPEEALETASYAELAPLCCAGATVFNAILTSKWSPGDVCLVQGVGGLGHLAIQYAHKLGMKVYAASSSSRKRELALSLGASEYIDCSESDIVERMQSVGGANLIICTAPHSDAISAILPAVAKNGVITLVSAATDGDIRVSNLLMNLNRATLRGFACGCAVDAENCIAYSAANEVKAVVQSFPMEDFNRAYDSVMHGDACLRNVIVFP